MTLFDRLPPRLDEPDLIEAAVAALSAKGYDRVAIEAALIRVAPVDLDLLAQCYLTLFGDGAVEPAGARRVADVLRNPAPAVRTTPAEPAIHHLRHAA